MIIPARTMAADKDCDSKKNRQLLRSKNIKTRIMHRKPKGKSAGNWQVKFNKGVSKFCF
jgi:hypothetical protein